MVVTEDPIAPLGDLMAKERVLSLNATAYRIFKILQWLEADGGLSVEALNTRFVSDALIRKQLSPDSIWLYLNTLRMLGCQITRPSPTNGFRHELLQHPFGIQLTSEEIQMMARCKQVAEQPFDYQQMLALDRFFKKLLGDQFLPDSDRHIQELFTQSRSVDFNKYQALLDELQTHMQAQTLLKLTYQSPLHGLEELFFQPQQLLYRRGVIYLQGTLEGRDDLSVLRIERIRRVEAVKESAMPRRSARRVDDKLPEKKAQVVVRFWGLDAEALSTLNFGELCEYHYKRSSLSNAPSNACPNALDVTLHTRDFFTLKQKLLAANLPFDVLEPLAFRKEIQTTLTEMRRLYQDPTPS